MDRRDGRQSPPPVTSDDGAAAIEDAVASAAVLMLRHRLFPRAMAWNIQQSVERVAEPAVQPPASAYAFQEGESARFQAPPPVPASHAGVSSETLTAAQLVMAAANTAGRMTIEDVARTFPLLQAVDGPAREFNRNNFSNEGSGVMEQDANASHHRREQLLRTVGKFLGDAEGPARRGGPQPSTVTHQMRGVLPLTINRVAADEDQQHAAFRAMTISTHSDDEGTSNLSVSSEDEKRLKCQPSQCLSTPPVSRDAFIDGFCFQLYARVRQQKAHARRWFDPS